MIVAAVAGSITESATSSGVVFGISEVNLMCVVKAQRTNLESLIMPFWPTRTREETFLMPFLKTAGLAVPKSDCEFVNIVFFYKQTHSWVRVG